MPLYDKPHLDHAKHLSGLIEKGATFGEYFRPVRNPSSCADNVAAQQPRQKTFVIRFLSPALREL